MTAMRKRNLIFYWLLIGVPAIVLTGTAIFSLRRIQADLARTELAEGERFSETVAFLLEDWVAGETDGLGKTLNAFPQGQLAESLYEVRRTNSLVRNVFIWEKGKGIVLPKKDSHSTEDQLFLGRYQGFFPPEYVWEAPEDGQESTQRNVSHGCKQWTDANGLQLLVWHRVSDQCIIGIEVEMMALLAGLPVFLPESIMQRNWEKGRNLSISYDHRASIGIALVDSRGRLTQEGDIPTDAEKTTFRHHKVPLGGMCPTWELEVYWRPHSTYGDGNSILLIGGALVFLLIASLFAGGYLFARDAARERRDALQKTTFVSNVSHELKTPLTNVRLYAELLADGHARTPEAQQQYLGVIVTESERLTRLINNVLDFGRLEQQRRVFHLETINLAAWLQSTAHALRGITDDAEMTVNVACPPDLCARVDRDALSQVLLNVIDNACKYARSGKVIDIECFKVGQTFLSADRQECRSHLALTISDRGPGMEARHAQRIFRRFYRVDDSTTASVGGCGLGLSIAKQLMQGMGGDICWKPRDGGGSTFLLTMLKP